MLSRVHHVGLVVRRLEDGLALWRDRFGLEVAKQATIEDQGVRAALLPIGNSEIELLEPIGADTGVGRFLAKRGEGPREQRRGRRSRRRAYTRPAADR